MHVFIVFREERFDGVPGIMDVYTSELSARMEVDRLKSMPVYKGDWFWIEEYEVSD